MPRTTRSTSTSPLVVATSCCRRRPTARPGSRTCSSFDDQARLVAIADGGRQELVEVDVERDRADRCADRRRRRSRSDSPARRSPMRRRGRIKARSRARSSSCRHTSVAYWQTAIGKETVGSPAWRHAERQLIVSAAATRDLGLAASAYDALRTHGGVELGDLVLASDGPRDARPTKTASPRSSRRSRARRSQVPRREPARDTQPGARRRRRSRGADDRSRRRTLRSCARSSRSRGGREQGGGRRARGDGRSRAPSCGWSAPARGHHGMTPLEPRFACGTRSRSARYKNIARRRRRSARV